MKTNSNLKLFKATFTPKERSVYLLSLLCGVIGASPLFLVANFYFQMTVEQIVVVGCLFLCLLFSGLHLASMITKRYKLSIKNGLKGFEDYDDFNGSIFYSYAISIFLGACLSYMVSTIMIDYYGFTVLPGAKEQYLSMGIVSIILASFLFSVKSRANYLFMSKGKSTILRSKHITNLTFLPYVILMIMVSPSPSEHFIMFFVTIIVFYQYYFKPAYKYFQKINRVNQKSI